MEENLVIVESPAKAKTIKKFLGDSFIVKSSFGHVRDLAKKDLGVDVDKNYSPNYIISPDKKKIVAELKKLASKSKLVWLASDEDREGEAISWHLKEVLGLKDDKIKRIVFHEITKEAIQKAVENPRNIDKNLVNAQQARRVLDRLVGFNLSPLLWRKIKPSLSAGRVQSVTVRLIVEREREIIKFKSVSKYKVIANFIANGKVFKAELNYKFDTGKEAYQFLELCKNAEFLVEDVQKKPSKKSPAPPFITSTLQQEASRKLKFSVSQTMRVAQTLYEHGYITYMRTDSVNLSNLALSTAKKSITEEFGEKYHKSRNYKTRSKGAQEAHEAIRPTFINNKTIEGTRQEQKLYELIWKRTVASQMADAELEKTIISVKTNNSKYKFIANGEIIKFDGFLKLYIESQDDENIEEINDMLPDVKAGQALSAKKIEAVEKYSTHPPRYTEASLVKKLEELGIGRPSTYAPTISTVQQRGYVSKEDRNGNKREVEVYTLENNEIKKRLKSENYGAEYGKLFPTSIGMVVNDYLIDNFDNIMNYNFTARIEKEFDEIALGNTEWTKMIDDFYKPFISQIEDSLKNTTAKKYERLLGNNPENGKPVVVKVGRYGPYVQIGENEEEPKFASLLKEQNIETITLDEAIALFRLPRNLGQFENEEVIVAIGKFGPYIRHNKKFYSIKKPDDPYTIEYDRAIEIINKSRENEKLFPREFKDAPNLKVLKGRYGPYISYNNKNYKIPRKIDPATISLEECWDIIKKIDNKNNK
ncbi:MAG: type I DNA topoisomerase [Bacteroidales bacterium]|nr:type I DNA topoisomerase [Bacteroidales bacterium]MDD4234890.1 type I DNA topoisomerase [Bacteroidales bacterium]